MLFSVSHNGNKISTLNYYFFLDLKPENFVSLFFFLFTELEFHGETTFYACLKCGTHARVLSPTFTHTLE